MRESDFQKGLIKEIKERFPGSVVLKTDPNYKQGTPDLLVLHEDKWGSLEVKARRTSRHQPNQDFYIDKMNKMSFASFIYPENKEEVLNEMEKAFRNT